MLKVCCIAALAVLAFVALGPATWQPRSGIGWEIDHFVGYFVYVLPRLARAVPGWGSSYGLRGAAGGLASFYAGSLVLLHGGRVQRRRGAGGCSAC